MKKYLNEEKYQKGKNGLRMAGILVISLGILIGGFLIFSGINKNKENEKAKEQYELEKQEKLLVLRQELSLLEQEIEELENTLTTSRNELQKIFTEDSGFSDRYYEQKNIVEQLSKDISKKNSEKVEKDSEIWRVENDFGNNFKNMNKNEGLFSIFPGISIIIASFMIGGMILLTAHRRNILAWQVQSILPVAEETLETVTPTIKKVGEELSPLYGNIAKEITKGIKEGIKDEEK